MKIKNNLIQILFAILLISFCIYNRLFVIRLPKYLWFYTNEYLNFNLIILVILSILLALLMLYKNIFINNKTSSNLFLSIIYKITNFIDDSLQKLYALIIELIPDNYIKISYLSQKFYAIVGNKSETIFLFILFIIRFIILFAFVIDVFIFFRLEYMYKTLYLLCISLIIKLLFFILNDFASNLDDIEKALIIEDKGIDFETKLPITIYYLKEDFQHFDLKYYVQEYILCSKLTGYLQNYSKYKEFFTPKINIIIYSIYIISWFYVIFKNFY